jgi:hypothetical protein
MTILIAHDRSLSHFDHAMADDLKTWRMPKYGICGLGSEYAGQTMEEIEQDTEDDEDYGTDTLCEIYQCCQMYPRSPGSVEWLFIRAFDASLDDEDMARYA